MKIDLVSRYFKPLKYSENVIRYVPKLPPSLFCYWWFLTPSTIFFPYLQYSLCLLAKKSLQNEFYVPFDNRFTKRRSK